MAFFIKAIGIWFSHKKRSSQIVQYTTPYFTKASMLKSPATSDPMNKLGICWAWRRLDSGALDNELSTKTNVRASKVNRYCTSFGLGSVTLEYIPYDFSIIFAGLSTTSAQNLSHSSGFSLHAAAKLIFRTSESLLDAWGSRLWRPNCHCCGV